MRALGAGGPEAGSLWLESGPVVWALSPVPVTTTVHLTHEPPVSPAGVVTEGCWLSGDSRARGALSLGGAGES